MANGTYFLCSKDTGRYADIANQTMSAGTVIHQWDFWGGASQRWIFTHLGDGYYSIKSANGSSYYMGVLDDSTANNQNIVLRTGSITDGMKWRISTTSRGNYKLTPKTGEANNRVLAVGWYAANANGINIQQRDYVDDTNLKDEWALHMQKDYTLMYIGRSVGDPAMPPIVSAVNVAFQTNANMEGYGYTSLTKDELLVHLSSSSIFSCITHGAVTAIATTDGVLQISDLDVLGSTAFDNLKFVYFGACLTGTGASGGTNLVNAVYNKGADAVLGFTTNVDVSETNSWTLSFMSTLATGVTINSALSAADIAVRNDPNVIVPYYSTGSTYRYLAGSGSLTPCL